MKLHYKAFILVLLSLGLLGCDEDGVPPDPNAGNCVVVPRPVVGQTEKYKETNYSFQVDIYTLDSTITSISDTSISITKDISLLDGLTIHREETKDYTISNNFIDYTKRTIHEVHTYSGQDAPPPITVDITNLYDPFRRRETGEICENQTWTTTYNRTTEKTTSEGEEPPFVESKSDIFTIEAINESKTVIAGTFNTYLLKHEFGNVVEKSWIDISTGKTVYSEEKTTTGDLYFTEELIE